MLKLKASAVYTIERIMPESAYYDVRHYLEGQTILCLDQRADGSLVRIERGMYRGLNILLTHFTVEDKHA